MGTVELYFDDFEVGMEFDTEERTVTEADVVNFAGLSGDFSALHMSREAGKKSIFSQNLAHGLCTLSIVSGLIVGEGILKKTMAFLGIKDWQYKKPVFFGDTVHVKVLVASKRATSNGKGGVIAFDLVVINQQNQVVQQGQWSIMIEKRQ